eukprot:s2865_g14.t1
MGLDVQVQQDKSLHIRWQVGEGAHRRFQLEVCYFEFEGPMLDPFHSTGVVEVERCAAYVPHPVEVPKNKAWVVQVVLKAVSEDGLLSEAVQKQKTWDDELSTEETTQDLNQRVAEFQTDFARFVVAKGDPRIVVVGAQHHGKSSHINHLSRCLQCDLTLNDRMDQAPAGEEEKTVALKPIQIPVGSSHIELVDTPAFPHMDPETQGKLRTLLSTGVKDGSRRQDMIEEKQSSFSKPPHGAIVVVSLCHWRDQKTEMQGYLQKMAGVVKTASGGTVVFPYVVAVTFRDEFLKDCQKENPKRELESAIEGIKKCAMTDHVYPITNYKRKSFGSVHTNEATFDLLSQLLEKAMREDTGKAVRKRIAKVAAASISVAGAVIFCIKTIKAMSRRRLIFSTSKAALAGYAQSLRGQPEVRVELFHYSEQDGLDADALEAQVLSASEVSVLLLATAASSYLWFDAEHCPRNVELCTTLRKHPEIRVNFIVCPTTESARDGWQQHVSDLQSVFGDFLPETGRVDLWTDFDPEEDLEQEQIRSLICRVQHRQSLQCQEVHQEPRSEWIWKPVGGFILVLVLGLGVRQFMRKLSSLSSQLQGLQDETRDLRHHIRLLKTEVVHLRNTPIPCSHGQSLQKWWEWLEGTCSTVASSLSPLVVTSLEDFNPWMG